MCVRAGCRSVPSAGGCVTVTGTWRNRHDTGLCWPKPWSHLEVKGESWSVAVRSQVCQVGKINMGTGGRRGGTAV